MPLCQPFKYLQITWELSSACRPVHSYFGQVDFAWYLCHKGALRTFLPRENRTPCLLVEGRTSCAVFVEVHRCPGPLLSSRPHSSEPCALCFRGVCAKWDFCQHCPIGTFAEVQEKKPAYSNFSPPFLGSASIRPRRNFVVLVYLFQPLSSGPDPGVLPFILAPTSSFSCTTWAEELTLAQLAPVAGNHSNQRAPCHSF